MGAHETCIVCGIPALQLYIKVVDGRFFEHMIDRMYC
jgi:hypothetical protein